VCLPVDLGWHALGLPPRRIDPRETCSFAGLDAALEDLDGSRPPGKRRLLEAAAACLEADLVATVNEVELLRAVAASIGCPMPPLVAQPVA